jgi:DNA-binding GntR family transcriptional regulator
MANKTAKAPAKAKALKRPKARGSSEIFEALRDRVVRHDLAPGSRLREQTLADEYGVPRAKVREALMALQERGLVDRIPNRGAVVIKLGLEQIFEMYQAREVLEGLAVRLATENCEPASWQDLVEMFKGPMRTYVREGEFEKFISGYELFRSRVITAAANSILTDMIDSIHERTQVVMRRIVVLPGRAEQGLREHSTVLAAMRRGDAPEAERCRRESMQSALKFVRQYSGFVV